MAEFEIRAVGIELDAAIAAVARMNGHRIITANLFNLNPHAYVGYDLMHFSPPCPSFSQANATGREAANDILLAIKIAIFIRVCKPRLFTLENVWRYRLSQSWTIIKKALADSGYRFDFWHLNAADYGLPQSRKRMVVAARRDGGTIHKPFPTHSKTGDFFTRPWVGWYAAIEDLLPDLPESALAPWQWRRMPEELKTMLVMSGNTNISPQDSRPGRGWLPVERPANTVMATGNLPRAFLVAGGNSRKNGNAATYLWDEPVMTITASGKSVHRAVIVGHQQPTPETVQLRRGDQPVWTVTTKDNGSVKAFVIGDQERQIAAAERHMFTVRAGENGGGLPRAFIEIRVVSMTPRALARF